MTEQHDSSISADTPMDNDAAAPQPLWLPRGSVRAVIALGVVGVWALLETGAVGVEASDAVRSIAVAIAAGYGLLRTREQKTGGSE
jgi:hypothetical protein